MAGAPGGDGELRISYRILLHLQRQGRLPQSELPTAARTQSGMVDALVVGQGALSNALQRLVDAGVVSVSKGHVQGQPTRLKFYLLTPHGETVVRDIASRLRNNGTRPR